MSEEEKAKQLFRKFHRELHGDNNWCWDKAKEFAEFVVDEMIKELNSVETNYDLATHGDKSLSNTVIQYWQRVKKIIQDI